MKKPIYCLILLILLILPAIACQHKDANIDKPLYSDFVAGIQKILPSGWQMEVIDQKGTMEPPHSLEGPLFRIDFFDRTHSFRDGANRTIFPSLRLYFYDIGDKESITQAIKLEEMYSWNIPEYYDETTEYIIVTSPLYINSGHYSGEAIALFQPLDKALKEFFNQYK
jgi:hypothetical protein